MKIIIVFYQKNYNDMGKYHFCFLITGMSISKGGIERLGSILGNWLVRKGYQITIIDSTPNCQPVYYLNPKIKLLHNPINESTQQIECLRNILKNLKPDVFVPMLSEKLFESVVEAWQGTNSKLIVSEHNCPYTIIKKRWNKISRIKTFQKADAIHLLLNSYKSSLPLELHNKISIVHNPIKVPIDNEYKTFDPDKKPNILLSVGRFSQQKRYDILIQAFSNIAFEYPDWELHIYGSGKLKSDIQRMINKCKLQDRILLKEVVEDIYKVYKEADILVMSSEHEGLPYVLCEAMSVGLPTIGFQGCSGINELIEHSKGGFLAEGINNVNSLSLCLIESMSLSFRELQKMGEYNIEKSKTFYQNKVCKQWEELLLSVAET